MYAAVLFSSFELISYLVPIVSHGQTTGDASIQPTEIIDELIILIDV
jgi:hypothetical protein